MTNQEDDFPLHIHLIDELKIGGAQTHLATILRESLDRYPFRHRVVSLFGDGAVGDQIRMLGIPVDVLDLRGHLGKRRFLRAAGVLQNLFLEHRPAMVEAHLTWSRLLGLYAARRAGVPLRIGFEQGDLYMNSWKFRIMNFVGQVCAHKIVVCSRALADWVVATHGVSRSRLVVLHNCVDIARFTPHRDKAMRQSFGFIGDPTIFVAAGTLGRGVNKRVDVILRGLAEARSRGGNVALVICGDGEQRAELEALSRDLQMDAWVRFLGMRGDVANVMSGSDVFCHATPFEPFGIVCVEAMAVGLPVIVPDGGGIREAVEVGTTGLLYPPLDSKALGRAMFDLAQDPRLRMEMGRAGRIAAEEKFSVTRYVERQYAAYGIEVAARAGSAVA